MTSMASILACKEGGPCSFPNVWRASEPGMALGLEVQQ